MPPPTLNSEEPLQAHALRTSHDSHIAHEGTLITSHFLDKINRTQHDEDINTRSHPRQITYQLINQFSTLCSQSYSKALFDYPQVQQCLFDTLRMAVSASYSLGSVAIRLAQAFSITEGTLGASHPEITRARGFLARAHLMASQYSAAVSLYQVTTTHFLNTLGPAHPDTIRARNELASAYCLAKRYADTITVHKEILAQLTRTPGPTTPRHHQSAQPTRMDLPVGRTIRRRHHCAQRDTRPTYENPRARIPRHHRGPRRTRMARPGRRTIHRRHHSRRGAAHRHHPHHSRPRRRPPPNYDGTRES